MKWKCVLLLFAWVLLIPSGASAAEERIKIVTYNIPGSYRGADDLSSMAQYFHDNQANIIVLQEVRADDGDMVKERLRDELNKLGTYYYSAVSYHPDKFGDWYVYFSTYPISDVTRFYMDNSRSANFVIASTPAGDMRVFNVHNKPQNDCEHTEMLIDYARQFTDLPIIGGGDFNLEFNDPDANYHCEHVLEKGIEFFTQLSCINPAQECGPTIKDSRGTIDYIFTKTDNPAIQLSDVYVDYEADWSDHLPVWGTVSAPIIVTPTPTVSSSCSIQVDNQLSTNQSLDVDVSGTGLPGRAVRLFLSQQQGNQISGLPSSVIERYDQENELYYYFLSECNADQSGTCQFNYQLSVAEFESDEYQLHCDVPTNGDLCSGYPFCDINGGQMNCQASGWRQCSANDSYEFTYQQPGKQCSGTIEERANIDKDSDNQVNVIDFSILITDFGDTTTDSQPYSNSDIDCNDVVDVIDFSHLIRFFGR